MKHPPFGTDQEFHGGRQRRDPELGATQGRPSAPTLPPRALVFFGSKPASASDAGNAIPPSTPFDQIHIAMLKMARNKVDVVSAWQGAVPSSHPGDGALTTSLKTDRGINNALDDIAAVTKHAGSKVIVYGYSLGGTCALDLSRRMTTALHLMVTIDAAVPFSNPDVNRRAGKFVQRNLNIFQRHQHIPTNTCGGPNTGPNVTNIDRSWFYNLRENQAHILIHGDTVTEAIRAIHNAFFNR